MTRNVRFTNLVFKWRHGTVHFMTHGDRFAASFAVNTISRSQPDMTQRPRLNERTQQTWKLTSLKTCKWAFRYANENLSFHKNKLRSQKAKQKQFNTVDLSFLRARGGFVSLHRTQICGDALNQSVCFVISCAGFTLPLIALRDGKLTDVFMLLSHTAALTCHTEWSW